MNKRVNFLPPLLISLLVAMLCATRTFGAGTPAGTIISSRATAIYTTSSGVTIDTVYSSFVLFAVKQGGALNVVPPSLARTSGDGVVVDYPFSVRNSGNGTDKFTLGWSSSHSWQIQLYHDINGNGSLDPSDSAAGIIASTDSVKADSGYTMIARVVVPNVESLNGQVDSAVISATSQFDATKSASGLFRTSVQTAMINTGASLSVDNLVPSPPGPVTFTLSLTNSGLVAATNVVAAEMFDARYSYVSSTGGGIHVSADSVRWVIGSLGPGASLTVSLTLNIQTSTPPGTVIPNSMVVAYSDGANARTKSTNVVNISVGSSFNVMMSPDSIASSKEPTDTVKYYYTVKNAGTLKDVIELAASSTQSLAWTFYRDANNNKTLDAGDPLLTNSNAKAGVDVDSVAAGDSVHIFAVAPVPFVQTDQTKDVTTFTASSSGDATKSHSVVAVTTMNIPVVAVTLSVSPPPSQQQAPGAVLTYTLSYANTGHADIDTSYLVTARIPDSTLYVVGSAKLGTLSLPDSSSVKNGVVSVRTGGLKQSTSGTVQFQVKIK